MPITYPASRLSVKTEVYLGDLGWVDISTKVLKQYQVVINQGVKIEDTGPGTPNGVRLTLNNSDRRFSPRYVSGPYYGRLRPGTKLRVSIDVGTGYTQLVQGEVATWTPRFQVGDARTVTIEAVDARRRFGQSSPALKSPIYNSTMAAGPVVFAPLEGGTRTDVATVATGAGSINVAGTISWGSETSLVGASGAPELTANSLISVKPPAGYAFHGHWQLDFFMKIPSAPAADTRMMVAYASGGTIPRWDFVVGPSSYRFVGVNSGGSAVIDSGPFAISGAFIGQWMHVRMMLRQDSSTGYTWNLVTFPVSGSGFFLSSTATGTIGNLSEGRIAGVQDGLAGVAVSSIAVYDAYNFSAVDSSASGYTGEAPTDRFLRLCTEVGVSATVREGATDDVRMGPQGSNDFMNNLRECLAANEGFMDADRSGNLRMTSRTYLQNRSVAMTVDYSARRAWDLIGADSDRLLVNDFTASRQGGSSFRVMQSSGPNNVNDPMDDIMGVGPKPGGETYNLESDASLGDHASFRVRRGTIDEPVLESLKIHYGRSGVAAALLTTWLGMDTFQRVNVTNPPADLGVDTLDQLIFGWEITINQFELIVDMNCRPASAYTVGTVESATLRLDSKDTHLLHALTTGDTTMRVANTSAEVDPTLWGHRDGNYLVRCGGLAEDINVTAVSGDNSAAAPSYIGAGTLAAAAQGSLVPGLPASMQKGDLMLLLASTRNASVGTVDTPSGWTLIESNVDGNFRLFGKIHTGTESAPTVTFTNNNLNDTTLARIAAWRNVQLIDWPDTTARVIVSSTLTSGSAQDIAIADAVTILRRGALVIYAGWKQDDLTSVASIVGLNRISADSSTLGSDASQVWDYKIITDVEVTASGSSWVVTGGAVAISRSMVLALDANVQILTVARAQNGVSLTHAAGEQMRVKSPIVLALPES